jgi:hypothetical protein
MTEIDVFKKIAEDDARFRKYHLEIEKKYILEEMITPLMGMVVVGGSVDSTDLEGNPLFTTPFPILHLKNTETGKIIHVLVSEDDECNGGGRLIPIT